MQLLLLVGLLLFISRPWYSFQAFVTTIGGGDWVYSTKTCRKKHLGDEFSKMDVPDFRLNVSATKQHRRATAPTVWSKELWNACLLPRIVRLHPAWWSRCIKRQVLSGFCSVCLAAGRQNYPELHKPEPASPGKAATPDIDWVMHQGLSPVPLSLRLRLPAWLHLIHPPLVM